ncbi:hypothetical protein FNV43_RR12643 [Rhamnella rubrinervis]|uniref:Uncharacterized protein n=1 Tax=Rhamnella rubrinervis TaxID=2594499 RepID=A0A8K0MIU2_9ROSA|nr:hypothetical protein FNV43_RR12643 [Rhamnella rubrinervis]
MIVNENLELDKVQYDKFGRIRMSVLFALSYGFRFAAIASIPIHVALFHGRTSKCHGGVSDSQLLLPLSSPFLLKSQVPPPIRYRKKWWQRYSYPLSEALNARVAFMAVLLHFTLGMENKDLHWWGSNPDIDTEHCELATCPTVKGILVEGRR